MASTYYLRTYNEAIEDVLLTLRFRFGFDETTDVYKRIKSLKK